ncbi:hypothetical protein DESPIG_00896 [Desulfovibrio piger ATCC 29098]|uniref:Uncharacterized protein n=1 Tax=Desulfovibrio piger ATCC 29098 TaxID=411464 RepID=B6WS50_9BACT|nr:hypothetical protein DESPIG_00896 [Desulfovibrio piger ATCC 29098]
MRKSCFSRGQRAKKDSMRSRQTASRADSGAGERPFAPGQPGCA